MLEHAPRACAHTRVCIRLTRACSASLQGHSGAIRSLCWREGDLGLISAGMDGAVYEWQWGADGTRSMERLQGSDFVLKSVKHEAVLCGPRSKGSTPIVVAGNDGALRDVEHGAVTTEKPMDLGKVGALCLSRSDRLLIAS